MKSSSDGTGSYGTYNSDRYAMHNRLDMKCSYTTLAGTRFYVECWNILLNQENRIFQTFSTSDQVSSSNPNTYSDIPFFLWIGVELCL